MHNSWRTRSAVRWAFYGAAFGLCFPVLAALIRKLQLGTDGAISSFSTDPLLWIILTAPLFLGLFAMLGGRQNDGVRALSQHLEERVQQRTAELEHASERMRLILDSAGDALLLVSLDGRLESAPSGVALEWFGPATDPRLCSWLFGADLRSAETFCVGLGQIADDILPFELLADQMPRSFKRAGRTYSLGFRRVERDGKLAAVLVIVRDTTAAEEAAQTERARREQHAIVAELLRDPIGFHQFRRETEGLLETICGETRQQERARALHTLKGNAGVMALNTLAQAVHEVEDALAATDHDWSGTYAQSLRSAWTRTIESVAEFGEVFEFDRLEVSHAELQNVLELAERERASHALLGELRSWMLQPAGPMLKRLATRTERIAQRFGRDLEVRIEGTHLRLDVDGAQAFWHVIVHILRNAVDHGCETAAERIAAGKPARARLEIVLAELTGGDLQLTIRDDGRGVDWNTVRDRARARGLPHDDLRALSAALFTDGLSTRDQVTQLSGRGVGLSAVKSVCDSLGIALSIESQPGAGTACRFQLPARLVGRAQLRAAA